MQTPQMSPAKRLIIRFNEGRPMLRCRYGRDMILVPLATAAEANEWQLAVEIGRYEQQLEQHHGKA